MDEGFVREENGLSSPEDAAAAEASPTRRSRRGESAPNGGSPYQVQSARSVGIS